MKRLSFSILLLLLLSCSTEEEKQSIDNPYYDQAYAFLDQRMNDSAFFSFNKAKDIFIEDNDSLNVGNCFMVMAILQKDAGDYFGAQETALEALNYLDTNKIEHYAYLAANFNNLGVASYQLKAYDKAKEFYNRALKYCTDSTRNKIYLNNLAKLYHDRGDYEHALSIYTKILKTKNINEREYARFLTNAALSRIYLDPDYHAVDDFLAGLKIRAREGDLRGLNSSYTHLTDYYTDVNTDSALFYAIKLYDVAKQLNNIEDEMKAVGKLALLSPANSAKTYFRTYRQLNDSVQSIRAAAKNQFAVIRYEVEKNKADNLRLQKENAEKINRLTRQRFFTGSLVFLLLLSVLGGRFWYRKRKQRLELEAKHKIKASQLKTSRQVHDVVANGIYRVMSEIENKEDIDREGILDKLEGVYHKSRNISYEAEDSLPTEHTYAQQITELLTSFANEQHKVLIVGNESQLWDNVNENIKTEIRHVFQELMVNMRKHSHTDQVVVRFEKIDAQLKIFYKDNGVGIKNVHVKGNGLKNTVSRIESLKGEIIFASEPGKGLKVEVALPIS